MNIVIAGAGAVGTHLAKMLSRQEHNIMLIDTNQDKLEDLESQIDILSIVGSCTSIGALKDAEVGKCDLYIAVNPQEDQNINSAILAKKLGAKRTPGSITVNIWKSKMQNTCVLSVSIH